MRVASGEHSASIHSNRGPVPKTGDDMPSPAEQGKEAIFEFIRTATEHSHVLFAVAGGLAIIEVLMIAHILSRQGTNKGGTGWQRLYGCTLVLLLILSALSNFTSLVAGYFGDAALVKSLETYAAEHTGEEWKPPETAEMMNVVQMGSLAAAFVFVWLAFLFFAPRLAGLLIEVEKARTDRWASQ